MSTAPVILVLGSSDNVAVALRTLEPGEALGELTVRDRIPFGHKLATAAIAAGGDVVKYDEVIGLASEPIPVGAHVHVHNVVSARLPGAVATREEVGS